MIPLQRKLRQLRAWQSLTLAECAKKAAWPIRDMVALECGERRQREQVQDNNALLIRLAHAYGVVPRLLERWLDDEWEWLVSSHDGNPQTLPRLAQYISRPLPVAAHNLFCGGFVVLDCETTGKDPHQGTEICEITVLDTDGVPLLNSLVRPSQPIPDELTANVHGISSEMVKDAPTFREIYPQVARAIEGQTLVVYNANYDVYLLDRLIIENGLDMPAFDQWCLMESYKTHIKSERWVKLGVACGQQGVEQDGDAHRSLADTISTWRLLQKLAMQHKA